MLLNHFKYKAILGQVLMKGKSGPGSRGSNALTAHVAFTKPLSPKLIPCSPTYSLWAICNTPG